MWWLRRSISATSAIGVPQRVRRGNPGKPAADDHDTLALRPRRVDNCLVPPGLNNKLRSWRTSFALPSRSLQQLPFGNK
jgi:hypothetical protein